MRIARVVVGLFCLSPLGTIAAGQVAPHDLTPYLMADRAVEIALARSAAPREISDSATVLVLTHRGYVEAAHGSNGFACLVLRGFSGSLSTPSAWWNPRVRAPLCLNPAAVRSALPEMTQRTTLVMAGVPDSDVVAREYRAYATRALPLPSGGAMSYMMSPRQYLSDTDPAWMPHIMFFYSGGHSGADWGAAGPTAPIIDGGTDARSGFGIFLVPLPEWSDGTPFSRH